MFFFCPPTCPALGCCHCVVSCVSCLWLLWCWVGRFLCFIGPVCVLCLAQFGLLKFEFPCRSAPTGAHTFACCLQPMQGHMGIPVPFCTFCVPWLLFSLKCHVSPRGVRTKMGNEKNMTSIHLFDHNDKATCDSHFAPGVQLYWV